MIFTVFSWLKRSSKNHERCSLSLNAKPVQIMNVASVVVHGRMFREKKIIKS